MVKNDFKKAGYIYVLSNVSYPDLFKIGFTTRNINLRVEELSSATGVPTPFKVEYSQSFKDCVQAEKYIHSILEIPGSRVTKKREFFKVSLSTIIDTIDYAKKVLDENEEVTISDHHIYSESDNYIREAKELYEKVHLLGGEKKVENRLKKAAELDNKEAYFLLGKLYLNERFEGLYDYSKAIKVLKYSLMLDKQENPKAYTEYVSDFYLEILEYIMLKYLPRSYDAVRMYKHQLTYDLPSIIKTLFMPEVNNVYVAYKLGKYVDGIHNSCYFSDYFYEYAVKNATKEQKEIGYKSRRKLLENEDKRSGLMAPIIVYDKWKLFVDFINLKEISSEDYELIKRRASLSDFTDFFMEDINLDIIETKIIFEMFLSKFISNEFRFPIFESEMKKMKPFLNNLIYLLRDISLKSQYLEDGQRASVYWNITGVKSSPWSYNSTDPKIEMGGKEYELDRHHRLYTALQLFRNVKVKCLEVVKTEEKTEITVKVLADNLHILDNIMIYDSLPSGDKINLGKLYMIDRMCSDTEQVTQIEKGSVGKIIINKKLTDEELSILENDKSAIQIVGNREDNLPNTTAESYELLKNEDLETHYMFDLIGNYEEIKDVEKWYANTYSETSKNNKKPVEKDTKITHENEKIDETEYFDDFNRQLTEIDYLPNKWYYWFLATIIMYNLGDLYFFIFDLLFDLPIIGFLLGVTFFYIGALIFFEGIAQFFNYLTHKAGKDNVLGMMTYMGYMFIFVPSRMSLSFVGGLVTLIANIVNSI